MPLCEKTYTVTLNIADPVAHCLARETDTLRALDAQYRGRCYMGAFIVEILRLTQLGDCVIVDTNMSADGYANVEFLALVAVVARYDILPQVVVIRREPTFYIGRAETRDGVVVAVSIGLSPASASLREGQAAPVRVLDAGYAPLAEEVAAIGAVLTCDARAPVYRVAGRLTPEDARRLRPLAARVRQLLADRAADTDRADATLFFESLLYAYRLPAGQPGATRVATVGAADWAGPAGVPPRPGAAAVNLLDTVAAAAGADGVDVSGVWRRGLHLYRSAPVAERAAEPPADWDAAVGYAPYGAFAELLATVHDALATVAELAALYGSADLIRSQDNIWLAMRTAQRPPPE